MPTPCIQSLGAKVTIVFPVAPGESPYGRLYCGFDISMAVIRNVPISSPVARSKLFVRFAESIQAPSIQFIALNPAALIGAAPATSVPDMMTPPRWA